MKRFLVILFVLVLTFECFALESQNSRIISLQSPLYDCIDMLYSLNGYAKPNTNRPWSEAQARMILEKISEGSQSGKALELYNKALSIIDEKQKWEFGDDFGMDVSLDLTAEGYVQTDKENFNTEEDWVRGFADRKPFVKVGFDFTVGENLWTTSDLCFRYSRGSVDDNWVSYINSGKAKQSSRDGNYYIGSYVVSSNAYYPETDYLFAQNFATNVFFNTYNFDFIWPHRAIVSASGKNFNVSINRDRMNIGDSHIGNLLVDDYSDYNDYFKLSAFGKAFTYDWYLMYFNTLTSDSEDPTTEGRIFMIHTLDFSIFDKVGFKISENVMYKYSTFDLQFLNPAFVYHNLNNRLMFNAIAYAEVNVQPIKGLNVYGQYALDQARAPNEGDGQSDSSGLVLGAEYTMPVKQYGILESYVEFVSTTPLLYRRDAVDFIKVSRYYHQGSNNKNGNGDNVAYGHYPEFEFIGFPFGGDCQALKIGAKFTDVDSYNAELSFMLLQHGATTIYTSHNVDENNDDSANLSGKTPSGDTITRAFVLSASGDYKFPSFVEWMDLTMEAEIDWIGRCNYTKSTDSVSNNQSDLQVSVGATVSI